ncbi:VIT1/CCC1 transporter family protein [Paracidobacterium acidisoli]|uniref:Rubrerythrin family protein n=1 Tax=Paracidobacterium acidisoli TaxID=2303751 RepID=A0A372IN02_9BACT|nr:VIT1/CCC1 transporter family protein [Paracidobacterium acidisoli]MBT9331908.1 VIT1/CCC1 transporter family protein [Paracidobacterium acidisoli]
MAAEKETSARQRKLLAALAENWQAEMSGYYTYNTLASRESDPLRSKTLHHLAKAELEHAELWAKRIAELGGTAPKYRGRPTGDADSMVNRIGGSQMALRRLEIDESRAIAHYGRQLQELGDEPSVAILRKVIEEEKEHYCELSDLIRRRYPKTVAAETPLAAKAQLEELLAKRKDTGRQTAGWIGDAIYGVNDGLGAIFGIVSGVSGATLGNSHYVLLAGIAGMIASALSMGSGAYLAAKSEREIYEAEVARERNAIQMNGPEARELMSLYYQVKGLPAEDADRVVDHLVRDPEQFLRALTTERLNSTEEALRDPLTSALSGALSTAVGAFIPIVPFFFLSGYPGVIASAVVSLLAHFAVGAAKSLITVRSWWASGMEMTLVGAVEGVVTYVIGIGLGRLGA